MHNSVNRRAVHNLQLSAGVTYVFTCGDVSLPAAAARLRLSCIMRCTVLLQSTRSFPSLVKKPVFFPRAHARIRLVHETTAGASKPGIRK